MAEQTKAKSTTELFKEALQAHYTEILGTKVSKEKAWDLFKVTQNAPFDFMLKRWEEAGKPEFKKNTRMTEPKDGSDPKEVEEWTKIDELILSLAGVGRYEILPAGARGSKAEAGFTFVPRPRYYPSTALTHEVEVAFGQAEPKEKATRKPPVRKAKASDAVAEEPKAEETTEASGEASTDVADDFDIDIDEI